ncbi:glycosyltransferase family 2 protein [Hymenobacter wooponensis]|uniref:Glycosyltransferase family 2 protein n=1 Tax=Hymenobacter wooponensis TaxID=1525360 RepID=A0A4Z0MU40_9BACT|nr:glycosyltransferase family 2 protein [Hymenobacter wooponensis]TGD82989.1 glycosyltransferase family 2 protein [Hymenobacter wooponensis]
MASAKPKVTVVIPNYNHSKYLPQRIESVLNQTEEDLDILILDDCSTDNSRAVIDEYAQKDDRIRTIYNEQNSGSTFKQWNKGFAEARAPYIWIAESDDYADPRFLEVLTAKLDANPKIGIVYCMSTDVDENGNLNHINHRLGFRRTDPQLWEQDFVMPGLTLVQRYMPLMCVIPNASAAVLRRSVSDQVGPADATMKLSGDWWFWSCMLAITNVAFVAEPLNYFRQHTNNVRSATLVSGVAFAEEAKMMVKLKRFNPDPALYKIKVNGLLPKWFYGMVNYRIPLQRNYEIYHNLAQVYPGFARKFVREFSKFLFSNKLSGIRQFVGDKMLAKISR